MVNENSCDSVIDLLHAPDEVKATDNKESVKIVEEVLDKCTTEEARNLYSTFNPIYSSFAAIRIFSHVCGEEVNKKHNFFLFHSRDYYICYRGG